MAALIPVPMDSGPTYLTWQSPPSTDITSTLPPKFLIAGLSMSRWPSTACHCNVHALLHLNFLILLHQFSSKHALNTYCNSCFSLLVIKNLAYFFDSFPKLLLKHSLNPHFHGGCRARTAPTCSCIDFEEWSTRLKRMHRIINGKETYAEIVKRQVKHLHAHTHASTKVDRTSLFICIIETKKSQNEPLWAKVGCTKWEKELVGWDFSKCNNDKGLSLSFYKLNWHRSRSKIMKQGGFKLCA